MVCEVIYSSYDQLDIDGELSIAIGCFDGLHLAHQELIKNVIFNAKKNNFFSAVLMFNPSPKQFFARNGTRNEDENFRSINPLEDNISLIKNIGPDKIIVLEFNEQFSKLTAKNFITFLVDKLNVKYVTTGCDFHFGKNRAGDKEVLHRASKKYNFIYHALNRISVDSENASSSHIKNLLEERCFRRAASLLGRNFYVNCEVQFVHSKNFPFGRCLELELKIDGTAIVPPQGIYHTTLHQKSRSKTTRYKGFTIVGNKGDAKSYVSFNDYEAISISDNAKYELDFLDFLFPFRGFSSEEVYEEAYLYQMQLNYKAAKYVSSFDA